MKQVNNMPINNKPHQKNTMTSEKPPYDETKVFSACVLMGTMKSKNFKANVIKLCNAVESEDWEEIQSYLMKSKWFNV